MQVYITGAQSVGKTTLIERLMQLPELSGIRVVKEVARDLIKANRIDLAVFQDYSNHQEEFYQFNLRLVQCYLDMARSDRQDLAVCASQPAQVKLYDRSGMDAINYIAVYLPHLRDRMLREQCVQDLLAEYSAGSGITMVLIPPHADFIVQDAVRLPPRLEELQRYTDSLRRLLTDCRMAWVEATDPCLLARTRLVAGLIHQGHEEAATGDGHGGGDRRYD